MDEVRTGDRAVYDGTVLELDGDRLIVELHQKSMHADGSQCSSCTHQTPYIHRQGPDQHEAAIPGRNTYLTSFIVGDQAGGDNKNDDERDADARRGRTPRFGICRFLRTKVYAPTKLYIRPPLFHDRRPRLGLMTGIPPTNTSLRLSLVVCSSFLRRCSWGLGSVTEGGC